MMARVRFVSPRAALLRIAGLPPEPQCFGQPEVGDVRMIFFCGCGHLSTPLSSSSKALIWLRLSEGLGLPSLPSATYSLKKKKQKTKKTVKTEIYIFI